MATDVVIEMDFSWLREGSLFELVDFHYISRVCNDLPSCCFLYVSVSHCLCLSLSLFLFVNLRLSLFLCMFLFVSFSLSLSLSLSLCLCLSFSFSLLPVSLWLSFTGCQGYWCSVYFGSGVSLWSVVVTLDGIACLNVELRLDRVRVKTNCPVPYQS